MDFLVRWGVQKTLEKQENIKKWREKNPKEYKKNSNNNNKQFWYTFYIKNYISAYKYTNYNIINIDNYDGLLDTDVGDYFFPTPLK